MTAREWTVRIKAPVGWLNVNQRKHRLAQVGDVAEWRKAGKQFCQSARVPRGLGRVEVTAVVRYPSEPVRRRDAPNVYPSIKAAIDGALVDAGVVADDNDSYVTALHILPGEPIPARPYGPAGELVLVIREVTDGTT